MIQHVACRVLTSYGDNLQVMLAQEHLPRLPIPQPPPPGTGHLDRAAALLAQDKLEEAHTAAAEATLHSTGLIPALELYAKLSDQLGYTDEAILAFKRILTLDSVSEETRRAVETYLADLYLRLHRYEDAEAYIELALLIQPVPKAIAFKAVIVLGRLYEARTRVRASRGARICAPERRCGAGEKGMDPLAVASVRRSRSCRT